MTNHGKVPGYISEILQVLSEDPMEGGKKHKDRLLRSLGTAKFAAEKGDSSLMLIMLCKAYAQLRNLRKDQRDQGYEPFSIDKLNIIAISLRSKSILWSDLADIMCMLPRMEYEPTQTAETEDTSDEQQ